MIILKFAACYVGLFLIMFPMQCVYQWAHTSLFDTEAQRKSEFKGYLIVTIIGCILGGTAIAWPWCFGCG